MASSLVSIVEQEPELISAGTSSQRKETVKNLETLPALFWDDNEEWNKEDYANNADKAALETLVHDCTTPEERADNYKTAGNKAMQYKNNKVYVRKAVQQYSLALLENVDNPSFNSVVYSNRAYAASLLGNISDALADAQKSVELDQANFKGWFRAAKSSLQLEKFDACIDFCMQGLKLGAESFEFEALKNAAHNGLKKKKTALVSEGEARSRILHFLKATSLRGLKFGPPLLGTGEHFPKLTADQTTMLYWVLFVYPESQQTDVVESFDERQCFSDQLDHMFSANAPELLWDTAKRYTRQNIEVYYQSNSVHAYTAGVLEEKLLNSILAVNRNEAEDVESESSDFLPPGQQFIQISEGSSLAEVLAEDGHIISGHPIFFVVSKATRFRSKFLAGEWKI